MEEVDEGIDWHGKLNFIYFSTDFYIDQTIVEIIVGKLKFTFTSIITIHCEHVQCILLLFINVVGNNIK